MRCWLTAMTLLAVPPLALAGDDPLALARERLLRGNYEEAREQFQASVAREPARAAVGLARAWRAEGKYEEALAALETALRRAPKDAAVLAEMADLAYFRGDWDAAARAAGESLAADTGQMLGHWVLARLHADRGDTAKADEELVWFVRAYSRRSNEGDDVTDPEELLLVGLAAVERARKDPRLNDQFQFVLTDVWGEAAKADRAFWPARFHRGKVFSEKYSYASAEKELNLALQTNPRAAEVLAARGVLALSRYRMGEAELAADQALAVNPRLPEAQRLKADVFLTAGDTKKAMEFLDRARAVNPRAEETLARIAACHRLDRDEKALAKLTESVERQNPKAAVFYYELAERLDERKRYADAEKYYKRSLQLQPKQAAARNQIGLLYMRLGQEEEARAHLDQAFERDPFNVRVFNTLKVLDHLKGYATHDTDHFRIRYHEDNDAVLVRFLAKYLEAIYEELAQQFDYRPEGPILIEVFDKHTMFSGRIIALPDLHTIGACTGKMFAMVSPKDRSGVIAKPFNWNRVVRHEMVHIFNLEQTNFLLPHWFTEGLAVRAERLPMPPQWVKILLRRVPKGELLNLDNIHLGFIRPASQEEWHLAYAQSKLYVDYLTKEHGDKAVAGLLDAYRDGLDTPAALQKVCGVTKADFEKGYGQYLATVLKDVAGAEPKDEPTFPELKKQYEKTPDDPAVCAGLAKQYFFLGNRDRARELADAALAKVTDHPVALLVKAQLAQAGGDGKDSRRLLEKALGAQAPHPDVFKLLGKLRFEAKDFAAAAEVFEHGREAQPYESYWLEQLARCYRQSGDNGKLIATLKLLAPTDADDLATRRTLAQLLAKEGQHAEAERWAWEALEIDVHDEDARTTLEESLKAQGKEKDLREFRELID